MFLAGAQKVLGTALKATGALLARALPIVGNLFFAYTLLEMVISRLIPEVSQFNKALEEAEKQTEQFARSQKQLSFSLSDASKTGIEAFRLTLNVMTGEMRESSVTLSAILDEMIADVESKRDSFLARNDRLGGFWGGIFSSFASPTQAMAPVSQAQQTAAQAAEAAAAKTAETADPKQVEKFLEQLTTRINSLGTELELMSATGKTSEGAFTSLQNRITKLSEIYGLFNGDAEVTTKVLNQAKSDVQAVAYEFGVLQSSVSSASQVVQDTRRWFVVREKDAVPLAEGVNLVARAIQAIGDGESIPEGVLAELQEVFDKFKTGPTTIDKLHESMVSMNKDLLDANRALKEAEANAQRTREKGGYANRIQAEVDLLTQRNAVAEAYIRVIESGLVPQALAVKLQERVEELNKKNADSSRKATILQRNWEKEIAQNTLRRLELEKQLLATKQQLTDEIFRQLEIQRDIMQQEALRAGLGELRPQDEAKFAMLAAKDKVRAAKVAFDYAEQSIALESAILDAKLKLLEAQFNLDNKINDEERAVLNATAALYEIQKDVVDKRLETAEAEIAAAEAQERAVAAGIAGGAFQGGSNVVDQITAFQVAMEALKNEGGIEAAFSTANLTAQVEAINGLMQPMIETAKQLGPEGEVIAAVTEGALLMADVFATAMETMGDSVQSKLLGSLQIAAGAVQALSSIMAASSKSNIAAVDKEIEAEKRRDGKSRESVNKIAALERKKEKLKKKQFEQDKKMKMAQVVINTAAGIMQAVGQMGPLGIAMAAVIAALGAAQLAVISGTTYEGGGAGTPSGPSKVALGERSSTIDVAQSNSPANELAYLRGERGVSSAGAENFIPSFTGRAAGGNTALMVGEQGPEMFIPDRPGTILPADDTENIGNAYNVNFTINTIDSQGMEDALRNQRGPIINMIREAANAHGEFFLEQVGTFEE
jgi:hypothetical protein